MILIDRLLLWYPIKAVDFKVIRFSFDCAVVAWLIEALRVEYVAVPITHYRGRAIYDEVGRNRNLFGQAKAYAMGHELERPGISVEFRNPGEDAMRTPGSGCQLTCELTSMSKCSSMGL